MWQNTMRRKAFIRQFLKNIPEEAQKVADLENKVLQETLEKSVAKTKMQYR